MSIIAGLYFAGILILEPTTITVLIGIIGGALLYQVGFIWIQLKIKKP